MNKCEGERSSASRFVAAWGPILIAAMVLGRCRMKTHKASLTTAQNCHASFGGNDKP